MDVDALLHRIGLDRRPAPDAAGLRTVHRAFLTSVPYEDLTIQLQEQRALDVDDVAERLLRGGRGGYCFELNGVLGALLEALGFEVVRHESTVGPRGARSRAEDPEPTNHLALEVRTGDGRAWFAEAGYGEGWLEPLPMEPGVHRPQPGPFGWTVDRDEDGAWWIGQHPWGSTAGVTVDPRPAQLADFAPHHHRLSCSPDSSFVRILLVERPLEDRVVTLRARTLKEKGPAIGGVEQVLPSADAFATTLRDRFGIDPDLLDLAHLWRKACRQHEEWLEDQARSAREAPTTDATAAARAPAATT